MLASPRDDLLKFYRSQGLQGADDELVPQQQIFLVGGSPLPLRLAAEVLAPQWLCLVASPESEETLGPLEDSLRELLPQARLLTRVLQDAHYPREMKDLLARLRREEGLGAKPLGLHYSGGTKTMGQNAVRALGTTALAACTYIDAERDQLRCDELDAGFKLGKVEVPLQELVALHGLEVKSHHDLRALAQEPPPRLKLAEEIGARCFQKEGGLEAYWRTLPPYLERTVKVPLVELGLPEGAVEKLEGSVRLEGARASHESLYKGSGVFARWSLAQARVLCPSLPEASDWKTLGKALGIGDPKKAVQYLVTDWFEDWLGLQMMKTKLFTELWQSTELQGPSTPPFELDLLARRGHDTVLVSCTTIAGKGAKGKALEALLRAQRLGGEMTRVVLASFTADDTTLTTLWRELSRLDPRSRDRFRVLGLSHYQGQAAVTHCEGDTPITQTLEEMFRSWYGEAA